MRGGKINSIECKEQSGIKHYFIINNLKKLKSLMEKEVLAEEIFDKMVIEIFKAADIKFDDFIKNNKRMEEKDKDIKLNIGSEIEEANKTEIKISKRVSGPSVFIYKYFKIIILIEVFISFVGWLFSNNRSSDFSN